MDANYLTIQGWMVSKLELSGNDLLTYALIYGFSQDGETEFTGSINYITRWLNCSRPTAIKALKNLTDRGYLLKSVITMNGVSFNRYKVDLGVVKNLTSPSKTDLGGSKESLQGVVKNLNRGSKESLPNNTINTIIDNIDNNRLLESEQSVSKSIHPLCLWIKEKLPNVSKIKNQLTNEEAERLVMEFSKDAIKEKLEAMENKAKCSTLYVSVNLTVRQWIGRERKSNPNYGLKSNTSNPDNIEFSLSEKAKLCRQYGIKFEYGDTNYIVPPQMTDEEKVAYRKLFDHYKDDEGPLHYEMNWNVNKVGIVQYVKNRNL